MHHTPLAALVAAVLSAGLVAQRGATDASAQRIPAWRKAVVWADSLATAKQRAAKDGRLVFAYFRGDERNCPRCRRVEKRVLETAAFADFAASVVPVSIDANVRSPRFVFLDTNGNEVATPRESTVAAFQKTGDALAVLAGLADVKKPTPRHTAARFVAELELGRLSLDQARARREKVQLDETQELAVRQEITNLVVKDLFARARKARDYSKLGAEFANLHAKGEVPTGHVARVYWSQLMHHARTNKDPALFRASYRSYRSLLGESDRLRSLYRRYDAILAELSRTK